MFWCVVIHSFRGCEEAKVHVESSVCIVGKIAPDVGMV